VKSNFKLLIKRQDTFYYYFLTNSFRKLRATKKIKVTQTMEGPAGVSKMEAPLSPAIAEQTPIPPVMRTIASGVFAKLRAAAAGIINIAAINKIPTTLIEMAIVIANDKVKISCSRFGFSPFA
jgi:hypothetical protein